MNGIILLGCPGSGKSTIGKEISKLFDIPYISSGDIARNMAKNDPIVREQLANGKMATESRMRTEIYRTLYAINVHDMEYVLDGFPRTIDQLQWLKQRFPNNIFIIVQCEYNTCFDRLSNRGREDDDSKTIMNRISYYQNNTIPVINKIINSHSNKYIIIDNNFTYDMTSIDKIVRDNR